MESSAEHVRRKPSERVLPLQALPNQETAPEPVSDEYAQAELESRKRRIELSIEKARRTT